MPYDEVFDKYKEGELHSGSKSGPKVKTHRQAVAIYLSEKRAAENGKTEYQPKEPEDHMREAFGRPRKN